MTDLDIQILNDILARIEALEAKHEQPTEPGSFDGLPIVTNLMLRAGWRVFPKSKGGHPGAALLAELYAAMWRARPKITERNAA